MRRGTIVTLAIACAMVLSTAGAALGLSTTMGNAAVDGTSTDGWTDFTVVDQNNPAAFDGYFDEVEFYAGRTGIINFIVLDTAGVVTYVSENIEVTGLGLQTVSLSEAAGVLTGDNLGYYTLGNGVIDYITGGDKVQWELLNSGRPAVGDTFDNVATNYSNRYRTYSMNTTVHASSPDICKKGGWEAYDYKNQGQCIASIVANDSATPHN